MTDEERRGIGRQAAAEMEMTNKAYDELRAAFVEELIATSPDQQIKRERLYGALHAMTSVRKALEMAVIAGKAAEGMINTRQILSETGFRTPY